MQTRIENELMMSAEYKKKIAAKAVKYRQTKFDKKSSNYNQRFGPIGPELVSAMAMKWAIKSADENAWFHHEQTRLAVVNNKLVSRWGSVFEEAIRKQAQLVLKY